MTRQKIIVQHITAQSAVVRIIFFTEELTEANCYAYQLKAAAE